MVSDKKLWLILSNYLLQPGPKVKLWWPKLFQQSSKLMLGTLPAASCQCCHVSTYQAALWCMWQLCKVTKLPRNTLLVNTMPCDKGSHFANCQIYQLAKWSIGKMVNWQNDQLAKWSTCKIVNWQIVIWQKLSGKMSVWVRYLATRGTGKVPNISIYFIVLKLL